MTKVPAVTRGSGNVFADLGFPDPEGELLRAGLTFEISKRIKTLALKQGEIVSRLSVTRSQAASLSSCSPTGLSTDQLLAILELLDFKIEVVLHPADRGSRNRSVRVLAEQS